MNIPTAHTIPTIPKITSPALGWVAAGGAVLREPSRSYVGPKSHVNAKVVGAPDRDCRCDDPKCYLFDSAHGPPCLVGKVLLTLVVEARYVRAGGALGVNFLQVRPLAQRVSHVDFAALPVFARLVLTAH